MKFKIVMLLFFASSWMAGCFSSFPNRIRKMPVPMENVIKSYRLTAEGDRLLGEGKDYFALLKYLEASTLNPYHEVIFNKLAIAYTRVQMLAQARRAAERSIGLNPEYSYAYNTQGIIYLAGREYDKAVRYFDKAIKLRPDLANFHVNLGHAFMQDGKFKKGREAYKNAVALDPQVFQNQDVIQLAYASPEMLDSERHFQMALFFGEVGDKKTCLQYLDKALAAGFSDERRLLTEVALGQLRQDSDFITLLGRYGISVQ